MVENRFVSGSRHLEHVPTLGMTNQEVNDRSDSIYLAISPSSKNTHIIKTITGLNRMPRYGGDIMQIEKRSGRHDGKYAIFRRFAYLAYGMKPDETQYNYTTFGDIPAGKVKVI